MIRFQFLACNKSSIVSRLLKDVGCVYLVIHLFIKKYYEIIYLWKREIAQYAVKK